MEAITLPGDRRYLLRAPATGPSPLVVFLHGTGGTAAWADGETGWSAIAAREGFAVALPEGMPIHPGKPPKFLTNPQRWNDGWTRPGDLLHTGADDVAFLAAVVEDAVARGVADPRRVFVSGFSNGAAMAFRFAAERADLVAAAAPVAGYCPPLDWKPARPVPTLFVIGTADPLVPPAGGTVRLPWGNRRVVRPPVGEGLARWATAMGCDPVPVTETDVDGVRTEAHPPWLRVVTVAGLGHHWPGGKGQLDPRFGGPYSARIDATRMAWEFFSHHGT
jgi:polyhydroxybutyrate depolymerase